MIVTDGDDLAERVLALTDDGVGTWSTPAPGVRTVRRGHRAGGPPGARWPRRGQRVEHQP
ncbi:hypothetical protein QJS66_12965 [Kocuria rhizophila]|nr:hypothetical protein QJS66_12965 [Kocuria rhizophila]